MKTGTHNDYVSYFSMGGSVSTEIIFPLLEPGADIHRQFLTCHSDFLSEGISHYTISKVCILYMSVES